MLTSYSSDVMPSLHSPDTVLATYRETIPGHQHPEATVSRVVGHTFAISLCAPDMHNISRTKHLKGAFSNLPQDKVQSHKKP